MLAMHYEDGDLHVSNPATRTKHTTPEQRQAVNEQIRRSMGSFTELVRHGGTITKLRKLLGDDKTAQVLAPSPATSDRVLAPSPAPSQSVVQSETDSNFANAMDLDTVNATPQRVSDAAQALLLVSNSQTHAQSTPTTTLFEQEAVCADGETDDTHDNEETASDHAFIDDSATTTQPSRSMYRAFDNSR